MGGPSQINPIVPSNAPVPARLGAGSWIIIVVLLVATGFVAYLGWMLGSGIENVSEAPGSSADARGEGE